MFAVSSFLFLEGTGFGGVRDSRSLAPRPSRSSPYTVCDSARAGTVSLQQLKALPAKPCSSSTGGPTTEAEAIGRREQAARALRNLAWSNPANQVAIVRARMLYKILDLVLDRE